MIINTSDISVVWSDCDPADIVYYPNYFAWFDAGAHRLFDSVGLSMAVLRSEYGLVGLPIVDARANFMLPSSHGESLKVESSIAEISKKSLKVAHRIFKKGDLAVEGYEVRIWAKRHPDDPDRLKTYPIPDTVRALLTGAQEASENAT